MCNICREEAIELIKKQIEDQGCTGDSFESLTLMQPHLYEWILLFKVQEEEISSRSGGTKK